MGSFTALVKAFEEIAPQAGIMSTVIKNLHRKNLVEGHMYSHRIQRLTQPDME